MDEVNSLLSTLDEKNHSTILKIIDFKIEDDMKEVLNAIKDIENKFSTVYWVIGFSTAFLSILLTAIPFF